ncbi:MAG: glycosyltransferase [Flavobacteriales bacterium]|nr:glycosyltransferase [Flavobacteriales bacterium]
MIIAADGGGLTLLKEEFPDLECVNLPGYRMKYSGNRSMNFQVFANVPKIFYLIYKEHKQLQKLVREFRLDAVISDNRYGLWSKKVYSVFVTHQIAIKCPPGLKFLEPILRGITSFFIAKYDRCWVPDVKEGDNLSGDLSHKHIFPLLRFIGPLSRFSPSNENGTKPEKKYDLMVSLSGPEPQRSIFEKLVMDQVKESKLKTIVVRGVPGETTYSVNGSTVHAHLNSKDMREAILSSEVVLSRPGYSTIMDLVTVGKKAVFVPTPGQTEQEYLAQSFKDRGLFYSEPQDEFDLSSAIKKAEKYPGIKLEPNPELLQEAVSRFLSRL